MSHAIEILQGAIEDHGLADSLAIIMNDMPHARVSWRPVAVLGCWSVLMTEVAYLEGK
jgi:hypothetical protein